MQMKVGGAKSGTLRGDCGGVGGVGGAERVWSMLGKRDVCGGVVGFGIGRAVWKIGV